MPDPTAAPDATDASPDPSANGHSETNPPNTLDATAEKAQEGLGVFERYLSLWVALCISAGVPIGQLIPAVPPVRGEMEGARVTLPIALRT